MPESNPEIKKEPQSSRRGIIIAGLAGAAAATIPTDIKLGQTYEKLSNSTDPRNIFEPGRHLINWEDIEDMKKRFKEGDSDTNMWNKNPQLTTRLASLRPQVLTLDSESALPAGEKLNKQYLWLSCPRPQKINPDGFYTAACDIDYDNVGIHMATATKNLPKVSDEYISEFKRSMNYDYRQPDQEINETLLRQEKIAIASTIGSILFGQGAAIMALGPRAREDKSLSRRTFLKGLTAGATALATTGALTEASRQIEENGPRSVSRALTEQQKLIQQTIISSVNEMPVNVWRDGRTALLLAKHEDAMQYLREKQGLPEEAKGVILLGDGHTYKADLYLNDEQARAEAILELAQHLTNIIDYVGFHNKYTPSQKAQAENLFLDYLATTEINHVNDPGMRPGEKLPDYIEANIQPVASFKSSQVEKAIKPLRPLQ